MVAVIRILPEPGTLVEGTGKKNMILLRNHVSQMWGLK